MCKQLVAQRVNSFARGDDRADPAVYNWDGFAFAVLWRRPGTRPNGVGFGALRGCLLWGAAGRAGGIPLHPAGRCIQGCFDVLTCVCLFLPCRREGGRGEKDQATRREAWPAEAEFSQLEEWRARLPKQWLRYYDVPNSAVPSPSCLGANTYDLERRP